MIAPEEASRIIRAHMKPVAAEAMPLLGALGRVVASPIVARTALPPRDSAACEGYAVRAADLAGPPGGAVSLPLTVATAAGRAWAPGQATWIGAGMPLPDGADAVVPLAAGGAPGEAISLPAGLARGANVRLAGEDVARGACVLDAGELLNAARIGLLAALGRESALVYSPLAVAVVSCGDDHAEPGRPLAAGQAYDANAYGLSAAIAESGARPFRVTAPGGAEAIRQALDAALTADVVIVTGASGPGDRAGLLVALGQLGHVWFSEVAQDPDGAFAFAVARGKPIFVLPGDPVAAAICFEVHVRSALRLMMGRAASERPRVLAIASAPHQREPGRQAILAAKVQKAGPAYYMRLVATRGPGLLGALAAANALAILPAASAGFGAGDLVEAALLDAPELCGMACLPVGGLTGAEPAPIPLRF